MSPRVAAPRGSAMAHALLGWPAMTTLASVASSTARPRSPIASTIVLVARARRVQCLAIGGAIFLAPRPPDRGADRRIEIATEELATVRAAQAVRDGARTLDPARAAEV